MPLSTFTAGRCIGNVVFMDLCQCEGTNSSDNLLDSERKKLFFLFTYKKKSFYQNRRHNLGIIIWIYRGMFGVHNIFCETPFKTKSMFCGHHYFLNPYLGLQICAENVSLLITILCSRRKISTIYCARRKKTLNKINYLKYISFYQKKKSKATRAPKITSLFTVLQAREKSQRTTKKI